MKAWPHRWLGASSLLQSHTGCLDPWSYAPVTQPKCEKHNPREEHDPWEAYTCQLQYPCIVTAFQLEWTDFLIQKLCITKWHRQRFTKPIWEATRRYLRTALGAKGHRCLSQVPRNGSQPQIGTATNLLNQKNHGCTWSNCKELLSSVERSIEPPVFSETESSALWKPKSSHPINPTKSANSAMIVMLMGQSSWAPSNRLRATGLQDFCSPCSFGCIDHLVDHTNPMFQHISVLFSPISWWVHDFMPQETRTSGQMLPSARGGVARTICAGSSCTWKKAMKLGET